VKVVRQDIRVEEGFRTRGRDLETLTNGENDATVGCIMSTGLKPSKALALSILADDADRRMGW